MRNLPLTFVLCSASQKYGKDFAKLCGLLRIYELYKLNIEASLRIKKEKISRAEKNLIDKHEHC